MKLYRIVSGGQTGADRTGLECARTLGLQTGGVAPKGYRTEAGPDDSLRNFGLAESTSSAYPPRTKLNVQHSDATLWFGNVQSPGFRITEQACILYGKPLYINPCKEVMALVAKQYGIVNVAGNRRSKNPDVVVQVIEAFQHLAKAMNK